MTNTEAWDRVAAKQAEMAGHQEASIISYTSLLNGDDVSSERDLRLLGSLEGKRVLEFGCGTGHNAVALVRQGAKAIAIEPSEQLAAHARRIAELSDVRIEVRVGDLADLAFLRAESVDVALSAGALAEVADLDRVLRQAHRVLKPNAAFVISLPHPFAMCIGRDSVLADGQLALGKTLLTRSYLGEGTISVDHLGESFNVELRSLSTLFQAFSRAGFAVDQLLELSPRNSSDSGPSLPSTVIWRLRRQGL